MKIKTAAKINLALDVTGRLENGYHLIESVFQTVGIFDDVEVTKADEISLVCDADPAYSIPCDSRNIAWKAAEIFFEETGIPSGCSITIKKNIPSQAGMGGGSTDAAAVLYLLNIITKAGLTDNELITIGKKIGADVPFFFMGGTVLVEGIGEKLTRLPSYAGRDLVIAQGTEGVSTAEAYRSIDALEDPLHPQVKKLTEKLKNAPEEAHKFFGNLFEQAIRLDEVNVIRQMMLEYGAVSACMTGSGSAVFGVFGGRAEAVCCAQKLTECGFRAKDCTTTDTAFIELS